MTKYRIYKVDQSRWDVFSEKWIRYYTLEELKENTHLENIGTYIGILIVTVIAFLIGNVINWIIGLILSFFYTSIIVLGLYLNDKLTPNKKKWVKSDHGKFKTKEGAERYAKRLGEFVK